MVLELREGKAKEEPVLKERQLFFPKLLVHASKNLFLDKANVMGMRPVQPHRALHEEDLQAWLNALLSPY